MTGALLSFSLMAIGVREASSVMGTFQILFFRSLVGLLVLFVLLSFTGWNQVRTQQTGVHLVRNIAHYGGQFGWFYAIAFLPLAEVFAIEFTVPVWTAIVAALLLNERINAARVAAIVLGIAGVLIILRPGIAIVHHAALVMLAGAMCYGLSHTLTRKLALQDTPLCILFYMTVIQLPLGLVPSLFNWQTPSGELWTWLLVIGLTALTAHYCMARAMTLADTMVVVPIDFLRLPLIALLGYVLYRERLEWFVLAGALLMLIGNLVSVITDRQSNSNTTGKQPG